MLGRLLVVVLALASACGSGPQAPAAAAPRVVCAENFCVAHPGDWEVVEVGEDFAVFRHPAALEEVVASVGQVDMEGLVTATGGTWPRTTDDVVRALWDLLDDGNADLGSLRLLSDGSVRSFGTFGGGRMWHRLVPVGGERGVGVEVRAPNSSWEAHADVFLDGLEVVRSP